MKKIILTIDVEDWFQVENLRSAFPTETWDQCEIRVEKNTRQLLDLFDEVAALTGKKVSATFFVLGWVAERFPKLPMEIKNRGHEVASHGYNHQRASELPRKELQNDLIRSRKLLEDLTGDRILGYRAPSFDISQDGLKLIGDCGYKYDSSYNSFSAHGRYGKVDLSDYPKKGIAVELSKDFLELPVSNLSVYKKVIPWGGGGYFRIIPTPVFNQGVKNILKKQDAYLYYTHPWEFDPGQPVINEIPGFYKLRHYINLHKAGKKLIRLLTALSDYKFVSCSQYINDDV